VRYVRDAVGLAWAGRCGILHTDHLGSASLTTDASGKRVGELRYKPYGETRYIWGVTRTDRRYTGQRWEAGLGLYDYGARYYDPLLGRFVSADTVVPEPGNPQSLNRFSYVLGNPLRYIDPSGHFEEDEIRRYLEHYFAGITDDDEREKKIEGILRQWKADEEWWSIIGPGGATYGDVLNSTRLLLGRPTSTLRGTFTHDLMHDTFMFSGKETFLEMPPMFGDYGSYGYYDEFYSLVDFYNETDDIIWGRPGSEGQLVYMGGTGYAANGAPLRWDKLADSIGHSGKATLAGFTGMGFLGAPEPTLITKALALVAFGVCGYEVWQGNIDNAQFALLALPFAVAISRTPECRDGGIRRGVKWK